MAAVIRAVSARVLALAFASCTSCATNPGFVAPSPQPVEFALRTWEAVHSTVNSPIGPRVGLPTDTQQLDGARCRVWNDRGESLVATPVVVQVLGSADDLRIECSAPGYRTAYLVLPCVTRGEMGAGEAILGAGTAVSMGLLASLGTLTPAGVLLTGAAIALTGHGIRKATADDANVCRYLPRGARVDLNLLKEGS